MRSFSRCFSLLLLLLPVLLFLVFPAASTPSTSDDSTTPPPINNLNPIIHARISLRCETSSTSPWSSDVLNAATILFTRGRKRCQQTNTVGSVCKLLKTLDTASIGICAIPGHWVTCQQAGEVAGKLVEKCQKFLNGAWRVGGYVLVDHNTRPEVVRIIVYNSGDN
ncbi:hypothetical protein P167DRAFT_575506 [Morchella conica CCBAS932]|uniref:Ecp2 effector protein domain-containing protein n=1 Tax=Morchella conica CCBAS932 TaxID=1392247 RepID=A0A3N4KP62_9PEZI|nr:hypothetical protein P167DRAFT_575506 [Morchella conica CCBAS932]